MEAKRKGTILLHFQSMDEQQPLPAPIAHWLEPTIFFVLDTKRHCLLACLVFH